MIKGKQEIVSVKYEKTTVVQNNERGWESVTLYTGKKIMYGPF